MRLLYDVLYKYFRVPWDIGIRSELKELVESGRIKPGRAIDLGSGTASNVIFLAQNGFDMTGIDFSAPAVMSGKKKAMKAGVRVKFFQDDLTKLSRDYGQFDLLVDYGTFDDLSIKGRDQYIENILPMAKPNSRFLMYVHEWPLRWWEKWRNFHFAVEPGEVQEYFGDHFDISRIAGAESINYNQYPAAWSTYLMVRQ